MHFGKVGGQRNYHGKAIVNMLDMAAQNIWRSEKGQSRLGRQKIVKNAPSLVNELLVLKRYSQYVNIFYNQPFSPLKQNDVA